MWGLRGAENVAHPTLEPVEVASGFVGAGQQRLDMLAQLRIIPAAIVEEGAAFLRRQCQHLEQQRLDLSGAWMFL